MRNTFHRLLALALAVAPLPLLLVGCAGGGANVCSNRCDCEGCSAPEFDRCLFEFDEDERKSASRDCLLEYDELRACEDATAFCKGGDFETSCKNEKERWKKCVD